MIYAKDKAQLVENEKKEKDEDPFGAEAERLFNANLDVLSGIEVFEREYAPLMSFMP